MKFWFGKKGAGPDEAACEVLSITDRDSGIGATHSSSILITPEQGGVLAGSGGLSVPPPAAAPAEVKRPAAAAGASSEVSKPAEAGVPRPPAAPVELTRGPAAPASTGKGAVVSVQAPVNRPLAVGLGGLGAAASAEAARPPRPVMTPVRPAASTAPIKLSPVAPGALASSAAPAPAAPAAPGFGFRPKDGVAAPAPVAPVGLRPAVPVAAAGPKPAVPAAVPAAAAAMAGSDKAPGMERDADGVVRPKTDQRALYYQLMNGLYDAVLILDDQGHIVDCNTRVTAMLGYTREDTWDVPIDKIITGMTSQMFEHLKRNLAENHHILIDARCFRQDGTSFAGEVGVSTLSLTRGSNIVFAIRNVDRRKSAMDEMRKGQSALEVALAPAFVCDLDGFFLIVNQAMLDAFGIPDEAQAKNVRFIDLIPDAARFFLRASCGEKLRESLRIPTPNGVPVKVELALKPVQSGQTVTAVAGSILQA